jgi:hypothetical protein
MLVELLESQTELPIKETSLSWPLRRIAYELTGREGHHLDGADYESFKLTEYSQFGGATGRQILIDISERFLKPVYGREIMAELLIREQRLFDGILLIRDGGFQVEANRLMLEYGTRNIHVVTVARYGTSFQNDSREWVNTNDSGMSTHLHNHGSLDELQLEVRRLISNLLACGWIL